MTGNTNTVDLTQVRPKRPLKPRLFRWGLTAAILIPFLWASLGLNLTWDRILSAPGDLWIILRQLVPPDLSPAQVQRALPKVMESLYIAWVGTMIAAVISLPLAFFAARNVTSRVTSGIFRNLFVIIRAVPEVILAIILIPVTGLGAWTGTLAIGLHSIGTLGKLSTETIEATDPGPVEAIAGVGGGKISRMRFGMLPQVLPTITAYWLYRFEINIRASAVLGVVGAGGIGTELVEQVNFRNWSRVGTVLFLTIAVVMTIDAISARLRRRIITGHREPGPIASFLKAGPLQRIGMTVFAMLIAYTVIYLLIQLQATV